MPTRAPDQIATEWVVLDKKCVADLSESERKQAQQWLGVHAWTANWDAAGFDGDNQGVVNGRVLTLDVGGALEFRAYGDLKEKILAPAWTNSTCCAAQRPILTRPDCLPT